MFRKMTAFALTLFAATGFAEVVVIEGFENTDDPANWQINLTANHTHNVALNGFAVPEFVTDHVTEGIRAGRFHNYWAQTSGTATANPYEPGGTNLFWSVRYNVNAPTSLPNNVINTEDAVLKADLANESPYPIQVALVLDTATNSGLERGPLVTIDGNSTGTYSWNIATQPPIGFDTGDGVISGNARLKSLLFYTTVQPEINELSVTVDNIHVVTEEDIVPPSVPQPLSFEQGPAPGQAILRWEAVADLDVASYNIYLSNDSMFNTPQVNRLAFPSTHESTVAATEQSVTLTGLATGQNIYAAITAVDDAPAPNESGKSQVLAVNLAADGSAPMDRLVLDHDEFAPGTTGFITNGYFHAAVYNAQALDGLSRTFDTVTALAVETNQSVLTPDPAGVVIWSNMLDGTSMPGNSISVSSLNRIQAFINNDGNIIVSGSAVASDVQTATGNLAVYLKATVVAGNPGELVEPVGRLGNVAALTTSLDPSNYLVAFATTENDGILGADGTVQLAHYSGVGSEDAVAGIGYASALVFLAFAFESAGDPAQPSASVSLRQSLMGAMLDYLIRETAAADWHLFD